MGVWGEIKIQIKNQEYNHLNNPYQGVAPPTTDSLMSGLQSNPSGYSDELSELREIFSRKHAPPLASVRFPERDFYGNFHFWGPLLHSSERQIERRKYFLISARLVSHLQAHSFLTITHITTLPNTAFTRTHTYAHACTWRNPTHTRVPMFTFAHMHLHVNTQCTSAETCSYLHMYYVHR